MSMTMTQKILAAHAVGRARAPRAPSLRAGELVMAKLDLVLGNDITAPVAIREFPKFGRGAVFDREKVALVPDHFTPNKDIKAAQQCACMRAFAREQGIANYFEVGHDCGIEHALIPEKGLVTAGDLVIGADSHTCTYGALGAFSTGVGSTDMACAMATGKAWFKVPEAIRIDLRGSLRRWVTGKDVILTLIRMLGVDGARYLSLEFAGEGVQALSVSDRLCIANMAIEAGAKNGMFPVDAQTLEYLRSHGAAEPVIYQADADAEYTKTVTLDLAEVEPTVAFPHLPENGRHFDEFGEIPIDQVVIGSCTNGRLEDLRIAAEIMAGRQCAPNVRVIVIPATQAIWLQAMREGLLEIFAASGAAVSAPTCGPCLGGHTGVLAKGERAVATTNRNFVGRMGHPESEVYLASPAVAAASALTGYIADPREVMA